MDNAARIRRREKRPATPGRRSTAATALLLGSLLGLAAPAAGATVDDIERTWRDRQARIESFDVHWSSLYRVSPLGYAHAFGDAGPLPDEEVAFETSFELTMVGQRQIRGSYRLPTVYQGELDFQTHTWVGGGNHGHRRLIWSEVRGYPEGYLGTPETLVPPGDRDSLLLLPVALTLRPLFEPLVSDFQQFGSRFEVQATEAVVEGRTCVVLRERDDESDAWRRTLWVDAEREFVPVRYQAFEGELLAWELTFADYEQESGEWVPAAWELTWYDGGQVTASHEARVVRRRVNQPIEPQRFRLPLPVGTWVQTADGEQFIQQVDGRRTITDEELAAGVDYDRLVADAVEPLEEPPQRRLAPRILLLLGILLLLAAALVVLVVLVRYFLSWRPSSGGR